MQQENKKMIKESQGFFAALDQTYRSTPGALRLYGIPEGSYHSDDEMLSIIHDMRTRIVTSERFSSEYILGVILCPITLQRTIFGTPVTTYLKENKGISSFLRIDEGFLPESNGVQLMSNLVHLDEFIELAKTEGMIGTKSRSIIKEVNETGIRDIVKQQLDVAKKVYESGLLPIIDPDVDVHMKDKKLAEFILKNVLLEELDRLDSTTDVILNLTLPEQANLYQELVNHPRVIRVLASSSGLKQSEADRRLNDNHGMIASFSRALSEDLSYEETDFEFDYYLQHTIQEIYNASLT